MSFVRCARALCVRSLRLLSEQREPHPRCAAAVEELKAALLEEFGTSHRRRRRRAQLGKGVRIRGSHVDQCKVWRQRATRLKKDNERLGKELARHTAAKAAGGRVAEEWILRVITCAPHTSARALSNAMHLAAGTDLQTVSRPTIGAIKSAWVEMHQNMVLARCRAHILQSLAATRRLGHKFLGAFLIHVQDEAELRLLSADSRDGPAVPRRARASKVQVNVLGLRMNDKHVAIPTELQALGNKRASTLATCFDVLLRRVLSEILPGSATGGPEIWLLHILVGDGIYTNEAAAKQLWANVQRLPMVPCGRYFLVVVKCGNHQAALSAKYAVVGDAAKAVSVGTAFTLVTASAVRLYKYALGDYYEEFVSSCHDWVRRTVALLPPAMAGQPQAAALQRLYTEHVVPDAVLRHVADVEGFAEDQRLAMANRWEDFVVRHLLVPDAHPTLTRFFTFRGCVDRMLLMALLDMPSTALVVRRVRPREENAKRLKKIQDFFLNAEAMQALRRASLCLQLTGGVEAFMATKPEGDPPVVALVNGDAHNLVVARLSRLMGALPLDPQLDLAPATGGLLACAADLILRLDGYKRYPFLICRLCRTWHPHTFLRACAAFLKEPAEALDVGFSMQLMELARATGGEMQAVSWLASDDVQAFLTDTCRALFLNSLEAERRAADAKQWVARKISHIATVSRDLMCARCQADRLLKARHVMAADKTLRGATFTSRGSLAFEEPRVRPKGVPFGGASRLPANGGASGLPATGGASSATGGATDESPIKTFAEECAHELFERRQEAIGVAQDTVRKLRECGDGVPITRLELAVWISENLVEFRERMRTAPARRRQLTLRLWPHENLPKPEQRLQPQADVGTTLQTAWAQILFGRTGWHGLDTTKGPRLFWLQCYHMRAFVIDLESFRDGAGYTLRDDFNIVAQLTPLAALEVALADTQVRRVFCFKVQGAPATGGGVTLHVVEGLHLISPLARTATKKVDEDSAGSDEEDYKHSESDFQSSECAVDTGSDECESTDASSSTTSEAEPTSALTDDLVKPAKRARGRHTPAAGGMKLSSQPRLYENDYFVIGRRVDGPSLICNIRERWIPEPQGMGRAVPMSRSISPHHLLEDVETPVRTMLCLRAWMVWRARQGGWASATPSRDRLFQEEAARLLFDMRRLQPQADGCLGNVRATTMVRTWVPDLCAKLA